MDIAHVFFPGLKPWATPKASLWDNLDHAYGIGDGTRSPDRRFIHDVIISCYDIILKVSPQGREIKSVQDILNINAIVTDA